VIGLTAYRESLPKRGGFLLCEVMCGLTHKHFLAVDEVEGAAERDGGSLGYEGAPYEFAGEVANLYELRLGNGHVDVAASACGLQQRSGIELCATDVTDSIYQLTNLEYFEWRTRQHEVVNGMAGQTALVADQAEVDSGGLEEREPATQSAVG